MLHRRKLRLSEEQNEDHYFCKCKKLLPKEIQKIFFTFIQAIVCCITRIDGIALKIEDCKSEVGLFCDNTDQCESKAVMASLNMNYLNNAKMNKITYFRYAMDNKALF